MGARRERPASPSAPCGRARARAAAARVLALALAALGVAALGAGALGPATALANPEPPAYDARSVGLGGTGLAYLDSAAALFHNPANLAGVPRLDVSAALTLVAVDLIVRVSSGKIPSLPTASRVPVRNDGEITGKP